MNKFVLFVIALAFFLAGSALSAESVEIIAHRGAPYTAPENTLASFNLGWKIGDGVELDIQRSKDGKAMVNHDADTKRTSGKYYLISATDSATLRTLDVGSYKGNQYAGEKIPFIEEVLAALPVNRTLFIELKCGQDVLPVLCAAIKDSHKQDCVRVMGFDINTMTAFKKLMPNVQVYWLCNKPYSQDTIKTAKDHGLDGLHLDATAVDKPLVDAVKSAGLKIHVWTVDDPLEIKHMIDIGVDGILTNRADVARNVLRHCKAN